MATEYEGVHGKLATFTVGGSPVIFESGSLSIAADLGSPYQNKVTGLKEPVVGREKRTVQLTGKLLNGSSQSFIPKQMKLEFDSVDYSLKSANYESTHDEADGTHGGTADNAKDAYAGLRDCKSTLVIITDKTIDEHTVFAPGVGETATLTFDTGCTVLGTFVPVSFNHTFSANGINEYTLEGYWSVITTETGVGIVTGGAAATCLLTMATGTATSKTYSASGIAMGKTISGDVTAEMTFQYNYQLNGALTTAIYANT